MVHTVVVGEYLAACSQCFSSINNSARKYIKHKCIRKLQITQTVHLILECPVVSDPERINNAISTLNNVVETDELVSIHLSVGWKIRVKPLPSDPLENSRN